eukprot:875126-Rhodomonas_salina.3
MLSAVVGNEQIAAGKIYNCGTDKSVVRRRIPANLSRVAHGRAPVPWSCSSQCMDRSGPMWWVEAERWGQRGGDDETLEWRGQGQLRVRLAMDCRIDGGVGRRCYSYEQICQMVAQVCGKQLYIANYNPKVSFCTPSRSRGG